MLAIDTRAARATWTAFLVLAGLALIYFARGTILLFVFAMFLAYMLSPIVNVIHRFTPANFSRTLTLAVVYLLLMGMAVSFIAAIGSRAVDEASSLAVRLPELLRTQGTIWDKPLPVLLEPWHKQIQLFVSEQLAAGTGQIMPFLKDAGISLLAGLGNLGFTLLVPILSFFFLKDAAQLREMVLAAVHEDNRNLFDQILTDINVLIGEYIRALVLLSAASFLSSLLFFEITGMQYGVLLAALIAIFEFVPVLGPLSAIFVAGIVGFFNDYPYLLVMVIFFACYRIFQDYVLSPYLMSEGVELHPLAVLFGVLAGEQVAGVAGMFLSIPVMATLRIIWVNASRNR